MANNEITFKIESHIGTLATYQNGWAKELNIVSWNGGQPKFDVRDWDPAHERMTKGVTLFEEELKALAQLVNRI